MISVVILTMNEEHDLPKCLHALDWCNDVHVLDSGSTDKTRDIAKQANVHVLIHQFESFGKQRNYALDNISFLHEWVLFIDADEIVTVPFRQAIMEAVKNAGNEVAGFYCCWKMMLEGRWLKHCDNFPKWQFRLLKIGRARFTDFGHGQKEEVRSGRIEYIKEPYLHYGFSKGWAHWVERHNRYSGQEAIARLTNRPPFRNIFSAHGSIRNPALKSWLSRVPGWPLIRFLYAYCINLGFTEGMPGFIYCVNIAWYEFLIQVKIREIKKRFNQPQPAVNDVQPGPVKYAQTGL